MSEQESLLRKHYGIHLVPGENLKDNKGARNLLCVMEDFLGEAMQKHMINLLALEQPTNQPNEIQVVADDTLKKYAPAKNLWINKKVGCIEIGTEVMLKDKEASVIDGKTRYLKKSKGQKFTCSTEMARTLGSHLIRLADELEGGR